MPSGGRGSRHRILALWCHPRSLSTAFERMMMQRGDFIVLHERFLYLYYVNQNPHLVIAGQLAETEPWMHAGFEEITAGILEVAARGPVFFKDMAVHVHNPKGYHADRAFLENFTNTFLIRHPERAVLSHLRQNPEMEFEEVGYDAQFALFERVAEMAGRSPVVVDAADLESDPEATVAAFCSAVAIPFVPAALRWGPGAPDTFAADDPWHADLYRTGGFQRNVEVFPPDLADHPRYAEYRDRSLPFYEAMHAHRLRPGGPAPPPEPQPAGGRLN